MERYRIGNLVKLWDTNQLEVACEFAMPARVHCIAMSPCATTHTLIAACSDGDAAIRLCDPATGTATHQLCGHRASPWAVCWSPRYEHELVTGGTDRSVRVWDIRRTSSCLRSLNMGDSVGERRRLGEWRREAAVSRTHTVAAAAREMGATHAHTAAITSVLYVADGLMILTAGRDHRLRLWDAHSGADRLVHFAGAFNTARHHRQMSVTAAGGPLHHARVFFPTADGLAVFDLLSGKKLHTLKAHMDEVTCCVASPKDARVFSGGADGNIHVWTPPPCGLSRPSPAEQLAQDDRRLHAERFALGGTSVGGTSAGTERGGAPPAVLEDRDEWSDDGDDDATPQPVPMHDQRRHRRPSSAGAHALQARKRVRR